MQAVGYRGACTLEFAEDRETGEYLFLEVNLRSYYHNQLFYDCGLNFPLAEYDLLTGQPASHSIVRLQQEGLHWVDFNRDLGSFYHKNRRGELGLSDWLRSLAKARSFAAFSIDDPKPWLRRSLALLGILARNIGRKRPGLAHDSSLAR
jgi:predicted ATP-grasp superfamily ATP-dependent carboligase